MFKLQLTNTKTKKIEFFETVEPFKAVIYVCGITPYDFSHIGHARCYINFDVLVRTLKFLGYQTTYIRNYTDIDDKLLDKARLQGDELGYLAIANEFILDFQKQMSRLGCLSPDVEPRATETISEMISLIYSLMEKGVAYASGNDVYLDITAIENYGSLSGKNIDELISGSRVEVDKNKKHAGDFVLWKGNSAEKFWESPFGYGRPGWHIECSAMIAKNCPNRPLDIHGGGHDLMFPHHENEIAQSEPAFGYKLANFWVHNAFVKIGTEKMSKSLGNSISITKLFEKILPMVFRFYVLQHSYLSPIEFCLTTALGVKKPMDRLAKILHSLILDRSEPLTLLELTEKLGSATSEQKEFFNNLCHNLTLDINTPVVVGLIFKDLDKIALWPESIKLLLSRFIKDVLGIKLSELSHTQELSQEIIDLIAERESARLARDFAKADLIRDKLKSLGHDILDKKL